MKTSRFYFGSALCLSAALLLSACGGATTSSSGTKPVTSQSSRTSLQNVEERLDKALEEAVVQAENASSIEESLAIYDELSKLKPNDPILATKYARKLREDKQLQKAEAILAPHAEASDPLAAPVTEMAMLKLSQGNYAAAESKARQAIDMVPENGRAYLALGTALDAQGGHEEAEAAFRQGIEYWRGDPAPIMNNLALNLASQGKLEEALSVLTRAREISPKRREIERNFRIISTLQETAGPPAPKPFKKPEPPKIEVKEEPKAKPKTAPKKSAEKKKVEVEVEVKDEKKKASDTEAAGKPTPLGVPGQTTQKWRTESVEN